MNIVFVNKQQSPALCLIILPGIKKIDYLLFVEPAGVEPASKRGSNTLSTCLSSSSFFVYRQDRSHQPLPYPLNLIVRTRLRPTIPDLTAPPDQRASRPRHLGDVSSPHLAGIKLQSTIIRLSSKSVIVFAR